jgi:hypothetical protein
METTVKIDDALLQAARQLALETHVDIDQLIEDSLRRTVELHRRPEPVQIKLPSLGRGGLRPGISLDNNAALLDLMDGIE